MKLVAIVGTNSDRSTNRKLLKFMAKHFSDSADIEILEIKGLPAFNEPEDKLAPAPVADFSQKIASADGVIIATPEYDHTIPAPLASALEWIAYTSRVLINKPTMIVGASLGALGTSRAQAHLRQILDAPELKARIMPGTEFFLGHSEQVLDDDFISITLKKSPNLKTISKNSNHLLRLVIKSLAKQTQTAKEHLLGKPNRR